MIVIADNQMPEKAKNTLNKIVKPVWLEPSQKVYKSIASHPDIFFCQHHEFLFASPEISDKIKRELDLAGINWVAGNKSPGSKYPATACYNAVASASLLIHNLKYTEHKIMDAYSTDRRLHVNQGYTRCNLICLNEQQFICSDIGITRKLFQYGKSVLYIDPTQIRLAGQTHGFFGGCCGLFEHQLVICGNPVLLREYEELEEFTKAAGYKMVSLMDDRLTDVGSLIFIS